MQPLIDSVQVEGASPPGACIAFAGSTAPAGFVLCDGAAYDSISNPSYAALYAVIGTTYGGTGASNFNVPDLRGVAVVGVNGGTFTSLGTTVGSENRTLSIGNMPAHDHGGSTTDTEPNHTHGISTQTSANNVSCVAHATTSGSSCGTKQTNGGGGHSHTFSVASQGSGNAFAIIQPSIALNYIISIG